MGSDLWLLMASVKEASRLRAVLSTDPPLEDVIGLGDFASYHCWLAWETKLKLVVSYSFGSDRDGLFTSLVCKEVARRFKVKRIGSSAVGWYSDTYWPALAMATPLERQQEAGPKYDLHSSWVEWLREFKPDYWESYYMAKKYGPSTQEPLERLMVLYNERQDYAKTLFDRSA